ncbi:MAG: hypothetical protein U0360_04025 [Dehalococcoidia bacterium]
MHTIKVVTHVRLDGDIDSSYEQARWKVEQLIGGRLSQPLAACPTSRTRGRAVAP